MQPLISIVIPVYNTEKYLKQCLDSVIRQTHQNLEIICVNDGSTDESLSILKKYRDKDHRIILIDQENRGLSAARNAGLKRVTADYVSFIDSDDYVDPSYIEVLYDGLYKKDVDFSACDVLAFGSDTKENILFSNWVRSKLKHISDASINPNEIVMMAWGKLFKMHLIKKNGLQFPEGLVNEDNYWNFLYCAFSKKYTIVYEKLYFYRRDNLNSIMSKAIFQKKHCYDIIKMCCRIFDSLQYTENFNIYQNYLDDFFFIQLDKWIRLHQKSSIDKNFWYEIKEYLVRSLSANEKFRSMSYFGLLENDVWN